MQLRVVMVLCEGSDVVDGLVVSGAGRGWLCCGELMRGGGHGIDGCELWWAGPWDADARGDKVHESELHGVQVPPDQGPPVAQGMGAVWLSGWHCGYVHCDVRSGGVRLCG